MDDVLPGVIIDAVLGIDMNQTDVFKGQLNKIMFYRSDDPEVVKKLKREVHFYCNHSEYFQKNYKGERGFN